MGWGIMSMKALIKLQDIDNAVIRSTSIPFDPYEDGSERDEFINHAWAVADQMKENLTSSDEWRLTLTFDLDFRKTFGHNSYDEVFEDGLFQGFDDACIAISKYALSFVKSTETTATLLAPEISVNTDNKKIKRNT